MHIIIHTIYKLHYPIRFTPIQIGTTCKLNFPIEILTMKFTHKFMEKTI